MARASTLGMMVLCTMDTGMKTRSMVLVSIHGLTAEDMKENGKTITCTEKDITPGRMVEGMRESMKTTGSRDSEPILGLMEDNTLAIGKTGNSMVKALTDSLTEPLRRGSGKMVEELNG